MTEQAYTPGPYFVRKRAGHAYVDNINARCLADCGDVAFSSSEPDAERIRLALTCHGALLAACEAFAASMDRPCASLQGLRDALVTPHALARGAIELAKKEPTDA